MLSNKLCNYIDNENFSMRNILNDKIINYFLNFHVLLSNFNRECFELRILTTTAKFSPDVFRVFMNNISDD